MVHGRTRPSLQSAATAEIERKVQSSEEAAEMMTKENQKKGRHKTLKKISSLLSDRSLAERHSILEELWEENGHIMEN